MPKLSSSGFSFLKKHEGVKYKPYKLDGEKYYTVGYGHYGPDVVPTKVYSESEVNKLFERDSTRFTNDVMSLWQDGMTQNMFDAMFSFAYNHGNISSTELGRAIRNGGWKDQNKISSIWKRSYCSGRYKKTLTRRRKEESELFFSNAPALPDNNDDTFGTPDNSFDSYESIYASSFDNDSNFSSDITSDMPNDTSSNVKHTRIYKSSNPTIVLDQLSIAYDERKLEDDASTGQNNSQTTA